MQLTGRDLTPGLRGDDVRLLQTELNQLGFAMPVTETASAFFGQATFAAVEQFQQQHGLPVTGVVDRPVAERINRELASQPFKRAIVQGAVRLATGAPATGVVVRAFHQALRDEVLLGQAVTEAQGTYRIDYRADATSLKGAAGVHLVVRAVNGLGLSLAASPVVRHAPSPVTVDLVVLPQDDPQLSEYDTLLQTLAPVVGDLPLGGWTEDQIAFAVQTTGAKPEAVRRLVDAARLSNATELVSPAVFYAIAAAGEPLSPDVLLDRDPHELVKLVDAAIERRLVPARLKENRDAILRHLQQMQFEGGRTGFRTVRGKLTAKEDGRGLPGLRLTVLDPGVTPPAVLDRAVTAADGAFAVAIVDLVSSLTGGARRLTFLVESADGREIARVDRDVPADDAVVEIIVGDPVPPAPTLARIAADLQLDLPSDLLSRLEERGVRTLADLRKAGGFDRLDDMPPATSGMRTLDAMAGLSALGDASTGTAAVVDAGFASASSVATAARVEFVGRTRSELGDFGAAKLQKQAKALDLVVRNAVTAGRVSAREFGWQPMESPDRAEATDSLADLFPASCDCEGCGSADGPLAYLADLADYAVHNLQRLEPGSDTGAPITLDDLAARFHQPLSDLPASCDQVEYRVRQVRLAIETLRRFLTAAGLPAAGSPEEARLADSHRRYLDGAYATVLGGLGTSPEELRLAIADGDPARRALATRLGLDPDQPAQLDALSLDGAALTEAALERLFGLRDTTRDPFTAPPPSELSVHRRDRLRQAWRAQDEASETPAIDPDLIGPEYLRTPTAGDPAFDLWQARTAELAGRVTALQQARATAASDAAWLDASCATILGAPAAALTALAADRAAGADISAAVRALNLTGPAFDRLLRALRLAALGPVAAPEAATAIDIFVQASKLKRIADWRAEERTAEVTIGPDHFLVPRPPDVVPSPPPRPLPPFRASEGALGTWRSTLRTRIEEDRALGAAIDAAVDAAEAAHLTTLRDALVEAGGQPVDRLSDALLLDLEMDGTVQTSRVSRAIEMLQGLLWSVRSGQLTDVHPDLVLVDENFDVAWKWLESYDAWRAAMRVFLYPENILLPSLRTHRSPAFEAVIERGRAQAPLSPANARGVATDYFAYLRDVASLQIGASCFAVTYTEPSGPGRLAGLRRVVHLFARATASQTVYWSMFDPEDGTSRAQTYWRQLPGLDHVTSIAGAVAHHVTPTKRHLYLFATVEHPNGQRLMTTRLNLDGAVGAWDEAPTAVAVKDDATDFRVVVKQSKRTDFPPELGLQLPRPNGRYDHFRGRLDVVGDALAVTNWQVLRLDTRDSLLALTPWGEDDVLMVTRFGSQLSVVASSLQTRVITQVLTSFHGATCWAGRNNLVYVFWREAAGLRYTAFWGDAAPVREPRTYTAAFLDGLELVAPHTTISAFEPPTQQVLVYQRAGTRPGIYLSRIELMPAPGLSMRSKPPATGPAGSGAIVLALRRDTGTFDPTQTGDFEIDPLPPPPPLPDDPLPPPLIRLEERERWRAAPHAPYLLGITAPIASHDLQLRRTAMAAIYAANLPSGQATRGVLDEAYYFVPVHLAQQLQQAGQFASALDWYRTVFDFTAPPDQRKIFDGLRREEQLDEVLQRSEDWLLDPLSPHEIAATRTNAYTRFTVLSIVGCFIDHADREFTRDRAESVERARLLYDTALELLTPTGPAPGTCAELIQDLDREIADDLDDSSEPGGSDWRPVWDHITDVLVEITATSTLETVLEQIRDVWVTTDPLETRLGRIHQLVADARATVTPAPPLTEVLAGSDDLLARAHLRLSRTPAFSAAVDRVSVAVGRDFADVVSGVARVPVAELEQDRTIEVPWLRERIRPIDVTKVFTESRPPLTVGTPLPDSVQPGGPLFETMADAAPLPLATSSQRFGPSFLAAPVFRFCVPDNPAVDALRRRVALSLHKIRTSRNIAGEVRELDPYPNADAGLAGGATRTFRPTPYRYSVLVDRAKQLVSFAQQAEAAFLGTLERRDGEELGLMRARQDLQIARAGLRLQDLRVTEAEGGIRLAEAQRNRAQIQADYYADLLGESSFGIGSLLSIGGAAAAAAASAGSLGLGIVAAGASLFSSWSSHNQREKEWERQLGITRQDVAIGNRQILVARDRVRVTEQERRISTIHTDNAAATAEFLAGKFTSAELYDWMSRVLEEVFRFFLQQATAMAALAEHQLAFERQEALPPFVQADYWEARNELDAAAGAAGTAGGSTADRRGLTGSARLLQDIFQLDQFAFQTDRRRLQLTKTLSLAQLGPAEFQRFRETGTLRFDTPIELFDRDFPGHYLRLVRRVRCTIVALIPPAGGIRATLASGGVSRVVVPIDGGFRTITVLRPPESVALSSPRDATGLFELSPQPQEFLLPFEGIGVDSSWQLQLPRAANRFDFATIADALITIEYTALDHPDHRAQVIRDLDQRLGGDRPFSFRHELADQWFDLNNPDALDPDDRMRARFTTRREDFPPNLEDLRIQHVAVYFSVRRGPGAPDLEIPITTLQFTGDDGAPAAGGAATTIRQIASTAQGNAAAWLPLQGRAPFGAWELVLRDPGSDGRDVLAALRDGTIADILLIVSYTAALPPWPD